MRIILADHHPQPLWRSRLCFRSSLDRVGDKLRELFATDDLGIVRFDEPAGMLHSLYACEHGQRLQLPAFELNAVATGRRWWSHMVRRQTVVWKNRADYAAWELFVAPGTDMSRSGVALPIFAGDGLFGFLSIENHERDNAFGEADVRLLSTVAAGMGTALENARLFEETRQALEQQRASAEVLSVISSSVSDAAPVFEKIMLRKL